MRQLYLIFWIYFLPICCFTASAQDSIYAKKVIKTLSSPDFHGRGYAFKGDSIAADFISKEFARLQLQSWTENYYQFYTFSTNVFEGNTKIDFGKNFSSTSSSDALQIAPHSASTKGTFKIIPATDKMKYSPKMKNKFIAIDMSQYNSEEKKQWNTFFNNNPWGAKGYLFIHENLGAYSPRKGCEKSDYTTIYLVKDSISGSLKKLSIDLDARFVENYQTQNVCGYIEGKRYPDTFFVFGAHYDHLGQIGTDYFFPGANDNAAGVAMVLDLANYFSKPENKPDYSIVFLAFSGEEVGLLGSSYFVENSPIPLENIKLMLNLDVMGTGEDGFTFVGGQVFENEFNTFVTINTEKEYAKKLVPRELAPNSDHYPFFKKGCKAMFIYGMGKSGKYHHPSDTLENLSLGGYANLFKLIVDYINSHNTN